MLSSNGAIAESNNSVTRQYHEIFSQEEEEGFSQKQHIFHEIITSIIANTGIFPEVQTKPKTLLRNPLCIYTASNLYVHPDQSEIMPEEVFHQQPILDSELMSKSAELASNAEPSAKISEFTTNNKLVCVYNKHNENLNGKNDMTIYIKNIKTVIQADMFKPFQKVYSVTPLKEERSMRPPSNPFQNYQLQFQSNFQCGNLHSVFKEINTENYYLFLQNDINTHGYNQWFNFWVSLTHIKQSKVPENKVRFNKSSSKNTIAHSVISQKKEKPQSEPSIYRAKFYIVNISKDIKYHEDMRIMTYRNGKWHYNTPFLYYKNKYERYNGMNYMTIQFQYDFPLEDNDQVVQFSLTYPYSYTKLIRLLKQLKTAESPKWNTEVETVGKSEGNNFIYLVKFLRKQLDNMNKSDKKQKNKNKKCVIVIGRQHPGEAVSSFICHHLINKILGSQIETQKECFDWFIFPMANPDGVIHGNSRTNLKGYDINRCWIKNAIFVSSEVNAISKAIQEIHDKYTISYILDLHGHSKDFGSFLYFPESNQKNKLLNYLFCERTQIFNYYKSKYGIGYKKRPTLRGQMFYREDIKSTITMETSLYGYKTVSQTGETRMIPFAEKHYKELASTIYDVLNQNQLAQNERQAMSNKTLMMKIEQMQKNRAYMKETEKDDGSSIDSDSEPEDEYLEKIERISLGIELMDKEERNYDDDKARRSENSFRYNSQPVMYEQEGIDERTKIRSALLNRYNMLNKKNKLVKSKRKPIYTNSNVQILSFDKMIQFDKSLKKYSMDQSNQTLPRKTIEEIEQKKNKRAMSSASDQRRVNGLHMRSQSIVQYPTSSVIKIDTEKVIKFQEQDAFFQKTREWIMKEKKTLADYRSTQKKKNVKSTIIRPMMMKNEPTYKERAKTFYRQKSQRKQSLKLAWSLLNRQQNPRKTQNMNKTSLSIISKKYQSR